MSIKAGWPIPMALVVAACAGYRYGDATYKTRVEAISAARTDLAQRANATSPASQRIGGSVLIAIPDRLAIILNDQSDAVIRGAPNPDQVNYRVQLREAAFLATADAIKKSAVFDDVTVARVNDPESLSVDEYDYKLWLLGQSATQWQWYLSKQGGTSPEPVNVDRGSTKSERLEAFVASVVQAAVKLGASPTEVAGAKDGRQHSSKGLVLTSTGTGFFINNAGFAMSNAHVVADCKELRALVSDEESTASLIVADVQNDLAVIKLPRRSEAAAQFRPAGTRLGESVVAFGFPYYGELSSRGVLSAGIVSALAGLADDSRNLQISAPVQPGNSGGPLFDSSGNVIGIVSSRLHAIRVAKVTGDIPQNVNFAIKANVATSFLDANGISYKTANTQKEMPVTDIGDRGKAISFVIGCLK